MRVFSLLVLHVLSVRRHDRWLLVETCECLKESKNSKSNVIVSDLDSKVFSRILRWLYL
jgi:hypothetical protein